jgi:hypothetical protein
MRKTMISIMILALILGLSLAACRIAGDDPKPIKGEESELSWQLSLPEVDADSWGLEDVYLDEDTGEAWAVGWKVIGDASPEPLVLHYQSDQWAEDDPAADVGTTSLVGVLMGVGVAPTGDVWCVGGYEGPIILVRDSDTGIWAPISEPEGGNWPDGLYDVAFQGQNATWVLGYSYESGEVSAGYYVTRILNFVNGQYVADASATLSGTISHAIDWADHGYAAGRIFGANYTSSPGIWESTDSYDVNKIAGLGILGALSDIDVLADGSGWAVGYDGYSDQPLLFQHSDAGWEQKTFSRTGGGALTSVSMVSASEGWAVGYMMLPNEDEQGILLSYLGGDWTEPFADVGKLAPYSWRLNAVSAIPTGEAWAVGTVTMDDGSRGIAFHYTRNRAPVLEPIGDQSYPLGGLLTFTVHATDPDGDPVTYSAFNLPPDNDSGDDPFDEASATFAWTGPNAGTYEGDTVFIATDSHGLSDFEVVHISPQFGAGE